MLTRLRERAGAYVWEPQPRIKLQGRAMHTYRRRQYATFGERSIVHRPLWTLGTHKIAIGSDVLVLHHSWLSVETYAWHKPGPVLRIGDRVGIRPFCTFSVTDGVDVEDDVIIGAYSSVVDNDHTFADGHPNVMHNPLVSSPVRIGRGTWIADRVAVLRGSCIGECCIIGANSVVRGEIPPYSIAVGAPARVVGTVDGVDASAPALASSLWGVGGSS
jgi:acetyltransferase-like isoleucine patch superfamily enzyme